MAKKRYDFSIFSEPQHLSKQVVADFLLTLNTEADIRGRVELMSEMFRDRFIAANATAPSIDGKSTNPFVLAAFANKNNINNIGGLDNLLVAAKIFSSLETAMGRVVEDVVPQRYG